MSPRVRFGSLSRAVLRQLCLFIVSARAAAGYGVGTVITPVNPETEKKMASDKVYSYNNKVDLKLKDGGGGIPFLVDIGAKKARGLVRNKGARLVNFYTGKKYNHARDLQTVKDGLYNSFKHGQTMTKGQSLVHSEDGLDGAIESAAKAYKEQYHAYKLGDFREASRKLEL